MCAHVCLLLSTVEHMCAGPGWFIITSCSGSRCYLRVTCELLRQVGVCNLSTASCSFQTYTILDCESGVEFHVLLETFVMLLEWESGSVFIDTSGNTQLKGAAIAKWLERCGGF